MVCEPFALVTTVVMMKLLVLKLSRKYRFQSRPPEKLNRFVSLKANGTFKRPPTLSLIERFCPESCETMVSNGVCETSVAGPSFTPVSLEEALAKKVKSGRAPAGGNRNW